MARCRNIAGNVPRRCRFIVPPLCVLWVGFALVVGQSKKDVADPSYREEVIEKISRLLETRYVIAEKARAFANALRAKSKAGAYAAVTEPAAFAEEVTSDLRAITRDQHLQVRPITSTGSGEKPESPLRQALHFLQLRDREHTGVFKLEWLEGRIAYLELRRFYPPSLAKDILAGAMAALIGADAVVVDLRENQGGAGEVLPYLCGPFFRQPTQLSSWYSRDRDFLEEFWTRREVSGGSLADVPLFLLTGPKTFSAAEMFAYDMQASRRATIVGEATRGGAHSVDLANIDAQFEMYISTGRAVHPLTASNWEGTGVLPDVRVEADRALDKTVELARTAGEEYRRRQDLAFRAVVAELQPLLDRAERLYREGLPGPAEEALSAFFRTGEKIGLDNEFFIGVLAYGYSAEKDAPILDSIMRKFVEYFSASSSAWELAAQVYEAGGKTGLALAHFRKALELDPENRNAAKMIQRLEKTSLR